MEEFELKKGGTTEDYSPSNIRIDIGGWDKTYYGKFEHDAVLSEMMRMLVKNGNSWKIPLETFESIKEKTQLNQRAGFQKVFSDMFEEEGEFLKLRDDRLPYFIEYHYQFSARNEFKKIRKRINSIF